MSKMVRSFIGLALLMGLCLHVSPARAVPTAQLTLTVDTFVDTNDPGFRACTATPGDCSLRGAISKANADAANATTIVLSAGTYVLTVAGQREDANATGDLDVTGGTLTMVGTGASTIDGGGIDRVLHVLSGAEVALEGVTITGGQTGYQTTSVGSDGDDGGGIRNAGHLTLRNVVVSDNATSAGASSGDGGDGGDGGGIYSTGVLTLETTTLSDNHTGRGSPSVFPMHGNAGGSGGGLYASGGARLTDTTVVSNTTGAGGAGMDGGDAGRGGGIYNVGTLTAAGTLVTGNVTGNGAAPWDTAHYTGGDGGDGGGIYSRAVMTLTSSTVSGNDTGAGSTGGANGDGGGLYVVLFSVHNSAVLEDVSIADNHAMGHGAGMVLQNDSTLGTPTATLRGVSFTGNVLTTGSYGGGLYTVKAEPQLIDTIFTGNCVRGGGSGGAIYVRSGTPTLTNARINGNYCNAYGGGIYVQAGSPVITNTTIAGNEAGWDKGSGIYNAGTGTPVVRNSIVWGNEGGDAIEYVSTPPDVAYSIVEGGWAAGTGNLDVDPVFVCDPDPGDGYWESLDDNDPGDLHLTPASPAIDAGDNGALPAAITTDLDGNSRFVDAASVPDTGGGTPPVVDMGAYEWRNLPPVSDAGSNQSIATGAIVMLNGSGSHDPDGHLPLTYQWTQSGGPAVALFDATAATTAFTAPDDPMVLTFTLSVTDSLGMPDPTPDVAVVKILNQPPMANAGPDQAVGASALVTLDGSGSHDPDGDLPLTYQWAQGGGPAVALNDATAVAPTFTAPDDSTVLTFTLNVTDSLGVQAMVPDTVVVAVTVYRVFLPLALRGP